MKSHRETRKQRLFSLGGALIVVAFLIGSLPLRVRSNLGRFLGGIFSLIPTRDRKICLLQLKLAFGKDAAKTMREVYKGLGETLFIGLNISPLVARGDSSITTQGWEDGANLLSMKKGLIVLTAHTASWDLLGAYANHRGLPLYAIGREAKGEAFHAVLEHLRERHGIRTIWRGGKFGIREISKHLGENKIVAALIDQDTRVSGAFSKFFFKEAHTPTSLIKIGLESGIPICTAFIIKTSPLKYLVQVSPISGISTPEAVCAEYNRRLEEIVSKHPAQWVWIHKRWRTMRDGRRLSSSEYIEYLTDLCRTAHRY